MGWRSGRATNCPTPNWSPSLAAIPTAALLPLLPLLAGNKIEPDVIVDAKSGVSGAGRTLRLSSHFSEVNEDVSAYGLGGHRHMPEIRQQLERAADTSVRLTFTPHLVPMTRGILATSYATPRPGVTLDDVRTALERHTAALRSSGEGAAATHEMDAGREPLLYHARMGRRERATDSGERNR